MPIPKATEVILTEEEQEGLEQSVRRHNVGQQIALRGRIILAEEQGQTNSAIARYHLESTQSQGFSIKI